MPSKLPMKTHLRRLNAVKIVTEQGVERCVRVAYIRVMDWNSTTSGITVAGDYRAWQLGWYLATQTGFVNLLATKLGIK